MRACIIKESTRFALLERFIMSHSISVVLTPLPTRTTDTHNGIYGSQLQLSARQPNQTDMGRNLPLFSVPRRLAPGIYRYTEASHQLSTTLGIPYKAKTSGTRASASLLLGRLELATARCRLTKPDSKYRGLPVTGN